MDKTDAWRIRLGISKDASVGLGQIFLKTAKDAEDAGFMESKSKDKIDRLNRLLDHDKNIDYIGAVLQYKAKVVLKLDAGNIKKLSKNKLIDLLKSYNGSRKYGLEVVKYLPILKGIF